MATTENDPRDQEQREKQSRLNYLDYVPSSGNTGADLAILSGMAVLGGGFWLFKRRRRKHREE